MELTMVNIEIIGSGYHYFVVGGTAQENRESALEFISMLPSGIFTLKIKYDNDTSWEIRTSVKEAKKIILSKT